MARFSGLLGPAQAGHYEPQVPWKGTGAGRALLFVHLALSPLLFSTATVGAFEFPKAALLWLVGIVCLALGLSALVGSRGRRPADGESPPALSVVWQPLLLGVVLLVASAAVSTCTSLSPAASLLGIHESHAGLLTVVAYAALFFATRALFRTWDDLRLLLSAGVLGAAGASAYAAIQALGCDPVAWTEAAGLAGYERPFGTLGHANFLAAYLVMSLPFILYFAARAAAGGRRGAAVVLGAVAALACAGVVLSVSRGAWLALGCVLLLLLLGALASGRYRAALAGLAVAGAAAGIVVGLVAFGGDTPALEALRARFANAADPIGRLHIWEGALAIFWDRPLTGCGPDAFQVAFGIHRPVGYWQAEWGLTPARAHNEFLHLLATQGLPGAAAAVLFLIGLGMAGVRALRRAPADTRPLVVAACAAAVGFVVQAAFSYTVVACGALFVTLAAVLSRCERGVPESAPTARGWHRVGLGVAGLLAACALGHVFVGTSAGVAVLAVLLAVLSAAGWAVVRANGTVGTPEGIFVPGSVPASAGWAALGRALFRTAVGGGAAAAVALAVIRPTVANVTARSGERLIEVKPQRAIDLLGEAALLDPLREDHWTRFAAAAQSAARRVKSPDQRRSLYTLARTALGRALALSPHNAYHHDNLGQLLGRMARERLVPIQTAYEAFDRALALDPYNVQFCGDATNAALGVEDFPRAEQYARRGVELWPTFGVTRAQLGYLVLRKGRQEEAARLLAEAAAGEWRDARQHERVVAVANLVTAYMNLKLYREAADVSRYALTLAPGLTPVRCRLAAALEKLGERREAIQRYQEVLRESPYLTEALAGLVRLGELKLPEESSRD